MNNLKKIFALICVFALIAIGWYFLDNFRSEPPTPIVTVNDTKIPTTLGSYCWNKILSNECVDKEYRHPIDMANEHDPTPVTPNEKIKIKFKRKPMSGTTEVEQWIDEEHIEKIKIENHTITAPKEKGVYVYYLLASWKQGDGNYAFSIKVK